MGNNNTSRSTNRKAYRVDSDVRARATLDHVIDDFGESSSSGYHSNHYNPYGEELDPLEIAIRHESINDVKRLMMTYKVDQRIGWDSTPVHVACENGSLPILEYLVDSCHGDVNVCDNKAGNTSPLVVAARSGHLLIVRYLLNKVIYV